MGVLVRNGGFPGKYFISASILFCCMRASRSIVPTKFKTSSSKANMGLTVSRSGQSAFAI